MKLELIGKPEGCKLLRLTIEIDATAGLSAMALIQSISIRGDFFAIPEEEFDALERALAGVALGKLGLEFSKLARERGLQCAGISGEGLDEIVHRHLATLNERN